MAIATGQKQVSNVKYYDVVAEIADFIIKGDTPNTSKFRMLLICAQ
jgi:hypothetical protein